MHQTWSLGGKGNVRQSILKYGTPQGPEENTGQRHRMAHYTALTRQLFFTNNNVKRFKTFVAMDRVKVGLGVPLPVPARR